VLDQVFQQEILPEFYQQTKKNYNKTMSKYIGTLTESYLFYKVNRYDIKGKRHLATQEI